MKFLKKLFRKKEAVKSPQNSLKDDVNKNYVCLTTDPINTVNDLRKGSWNMDKVRQGFAMGILRYAKQSEVDKARELGIIKD
ncbi:hypothetical protein [Parageobacillus toebii]|uniref:hypothetical protein n=1 Tax=Parageobacillus toebii TaxID=153151 RepID=UPI002E202A3C|nr:hypothetical protein [Parageobacillus toebii]